MRAPDREGFALVAVLWAVVGIAALGMAAQLAARELVVAELNRAELSRAAWEAEGCVARARAAAAEAMRLPDDGDGGAWNRLDRVVAGSPLAAGCDLQLRAAGATLNANAADPEGLQRLLAAAGEPPARADSLADALLDWRDSDRDPRPFGAEADDYLRAGEPPPRDGPLRDSREVLRVRGWSRVPGALELLGSEPGRVPLHQAPLPVLASLPGFTAETLARLEDARVRDAPFTDLIALESALTPGAGAQLRTHFQELSTSTTPQPDAWVVTARGRGASRPVTAVVQVRIARAGTRPAVVRQRSWIE